MKRVIEIIEEYQIRSITSMQHREQGEDNERSLTRMMGGNAWRATEIEEQLTSHHAVPARGANDCRPANLNFLK